ncbi:hypothetical protein F4811DRAFT_555423 [Daldinia bambusicola]|nr:hypothetical protein F4811DRAFT_555423 [Daldinia bambusicola]
MGPKVGIQVSEKREGIATSSETAGYPPPNEHPISGDTRFSTLNRPWMDYEHRLRNSLEGNFPQETQTYNGNIMERWKSQPMADDPYHNINSIIVPTKTDKSRTSNTKSPKPTRPISEAVATAGSK